MRFKRKLFLSPVPILPCFPPAAARRSPGPPLPAAARCPFASPQRLAVSSSASALTRPSPAEMEALRAYLTPQKAAKKLRLEETADEASAASADLDLEGMEEVVHGDENDERDREQPPWWAVQQYTMLKELKEQMSCVQSLEKDVKTVKEEMLHVKLQASLTQEAAEQALDVATNVEDRVQSLESDLVRHADIKKMIEEAVSALKAVTAETMSSMRPMQGMRQNSSVSPDDKMSRIAVFGGFAYDTPKDEIVDFLSKDVEPDREH